MPCDELFVSDSDTRVTTLGDRGVGVDDQGRKDASVVQAELRGGGSEIATRELQRLVIEESVLATKG